MKARRISKMQMPSGKHFLYESIAHRLREEIASGTFQPGERLPSLDTFSETFRVNRLTVRKAIEVLREEGLVYAIPAQGTYVRQVQEGAPASGTARAQGAGSARHPARKSRVVGLLSQVLVPSNFGPYHQEIIAGINEALPEYGANLLIYAVGMMRPEELAEIRDSAPTDAMIYMGPFDRVLLARLVRSGPPAVLVDFEARGLPCDSICIDNELGGYAVGQLLLETGCGDRFALITGTADDAVADRMAGVRRAFSEAGARYAPLAVINGHYTRKGGYEAASSLLSRGRPLPKAKRFSASTMRWRWAHWMRSRKRTSGFRSRFASSVLTAFPWGRQSVPDCPPFPSTCAKSGVRRYKRCFAGWKTPRGFPCG